MKNYNVSAPFAPKQSYIAGYDKLTQEKKDKIYASKKCDREIFNAFLNLNYILNIEKTGISQYYANLISDYVQAKSNYKPRNIFYEFIRMKKHKILNLCLILRKGFTPKRVYYNYRVLADMHEK